ncbi:MAG: nucleotidyltransferase domain-containing protein [Chloroflexi bacterium]|nr:nucleotidyltransferase domain-containing protein [Chloroflexota bacterium]
MNTSGLITEIVDRLKSVPGVEAVVLGGSRARGTHTESSDVDLGIYYAPSLPLDLAELTRVAAGLDDEHRPNLVTGPGGWGPWINGGGWLKVGGLPVDFIYRDLDKVERVIFDCCAGRIEIAYQPGHPHSFVSSIYLAEVALCQPLWDPRGTLARLKDRIIPYPPRLKQAILDAFWWEVDFSLGIAQKSISRGDVAYAAGCCFRCVACLLQTLFAVNEQYWMNEKGAVALAADFQYAPANLKERVEWTFEQLSGAGPSISEALHTLGELVEDCRKWVGRE